MGLPGAASHQIQTGVFDDLPRELGYDDGAPVWWPLPVLGLAGLVTAFAIVRLPGGGGHDPAEGLNAGADAARSSCRA